jgi:hypothetical protein
MVDPSDFNLDKAQGSATATPQSRSPIPVVIGAVALVAVGLTVWFLLPGERAPEPVDDPPLISEAPPTLPTGPIGVCQPGAPSAGAGDAPIALPPLDASDTLVGMLAGTLSSNPRVAAWMATDDIVRRFTVVIDNIARGSSPAVQLGTLRPASPFMVTGGGNGLLLDPQSYRRYTPVATAVQSVDVQAAAQLCGALRPRLDEAFAELGGTQSFEEALEQAIVALLRTPVVTGDVRIVPNDGTYAFRDVELESLTPAQKHLARMGPENTRMIQETLRQLALAIGIPAERLPQPGR